MDPQEQRLLAAEAAHAEVVVGHAHNSVEGAQRKVEKAKRDLEAAKEALAEAKERLREAKQHARDLPVDGQSPDDGEVVEAQAETAEIKAEEV